MAPSSSQDKDKHSLSTDQTKLLCQVMTTGNVTLTPAQWSEVASTLGISNGKAAKERFRYLMNQLNGTPTKSSRGHAAITSKEPSTPTLKAKATPKKEAPKTPASGKNKTVKTSAQKRKREEDQENAEIETPSKKQKGVTGADNEPSPTKLTQADGQNVEKTQTQTQTHTGITIVDFPSIRDIQVKNKDGNNRNHNPLLNLGSDAIKFLTSTPSKPLSATQPVPGTWASYNNGAQIQSQDIKDEVDVNSADARDEKIHDHPFDTYLAEEGFGAIGGGEGSMFPDAGDEVA